MTAVAICPTYRRLLVPNILAMWEKQTFEDRFLIILDDGQTYDDQSGENWMLISESERYPSLGEKFHALASLAATFGEYILLFEDDDVYFPDYVTNHVKTLESYEISVPESVYSDDRFDGDIPHIRPACNHKNKTAMHHGSWAYRSSTYKETSGYPEGRIDFDMALWNELSRDRGIGNPLDHGPIQYVYRWQTSGYRNGSGYGSTMHESVEKSHPKVRHEGKVSPLMDEVTSRYYRSCVQA